MKMYVQTRCFGRDADGARPTLHNHAPNLAGKKKTKSTLPQQKTTNCHFPPNTRGGQCFQKAKEEGNAKIRIISLLDWLLINNRSNLFLIKNLN